MSILDSTANICNCLVAENAGRTGRGALEGGGVYCWNTNLHVDRCTIVNNRALASGGGIRMGYGNSVIENSTICCNDGGNEYGGGLYATGILSVSNCFLSYNNVDMIGGGGGAICMIGGGNVEGCTITDNRAAWGGGLCLGSSSTVIHCVVADNRALGGGGIHVYSGISLMYQCTIDGNQANVNGGGAYCLGRGHFSFCRIVENQSGMRGGGIAGSERGVFEGCIIADNKSGWDGGGMWRNAIADGLSKNCVFSGNRAVKRGGAVYYSGDGDDPTFENCVFINNVAGSGNAVYNEKGLGELRSCVLVNGGTNEIFEGEWADTDVVYSNVGGGWSGWGNIDADPVFVDPQNNNYRLQGESPCIDSGSTGGPEEDLDGNPRPIDIPGVGREGAGAFDMGVYEYPLGGYPTPTETPMPTPTLTPTPVPTMDERSDVNQNGKVDAEDLLMLLLDWRP
jgi:predicted outer membrane repeat protein